VTAPTCYLGRSDRGGRVVQARLVGARTDESWSNGEHLPAEAAALAAEWVADRMRQGGERDALGVLCIDVDGGACGWLTAPSTDPAVLAAAAQAGSLPGEGGGASGPLAGMNPTEASLQALVVHEEPRRVPFARRIAAASRLPEGDRLAVLALPDVAARLFIDELDDRGVGVERVVSLWHALALAWDPGAPQGDGGGAREDRVVGASAPVSAVILYDRSGRLIWSWSRAGELLTGGTMRLVVEGAEASRAVQIAKADVSRLTADWLGWSVQLGTAPSRIVVLGPRTDDGAGILGPGALGEALIRAWPGATTDLVSLDDPIGATLARLSAQSGGPETDPRASLVRLTHRPSHAHRSLLRAVGLAVGAGAVALTAVAWKAWESAATIRRRAEEMRVSTRLEIAKEVSIPADSPFPEKDLEGEVAKLRAAREAPKDVQPVKPILDELDTLSFVLSGIEGVEVEEYTMLDSAVSIRLSVPDTHAGEAIIQSLKEIGGSRCEWKGQFAPASGATRLVYTLTGAWLPGRGGGGGGGDSP
jgi:hypothetical protein